MSISQIVKLVLFFYFLIYSQNITVLDIYNIFNEG